MENHVSKRKPQNKRLNLWIYKIFNVHTFDHQTSCGEFFFLLYNKFTQYSVWLSLLYLFLVFSISIHRFFCVAFFNDERLPLPISLLWIWSHISTLNKNDSWLLFFNCVIANRNGKFFRYFLVFSCKTISTPCGYVFCLFTLYIIFTCTQNEWIEYV